MDKKEIYDLIDPALSNLYYLNDLINEDDFGEEIMLLHDIIQNVEKIYIELKKDVT